MVGSLVGIYFQVNGNLSYTGVLFKEPRGLGDRNSISYAEETLYSQAANLGDKRLCYVVRFWKTFLLIREDLHPSATAFEDLIFKMG